MSQGLGFFVLFYICSEGRRESHSLLSDYISTWDGEQSLNDTLQSSIGRVFQG